MFHVKRWPAPPSSALSHHSRHADQSHLGACGRRVDGENKSVSHKTVLGATIFSTVASRSSCRPGMWELVDED